MITNNQLIKMKRKKKTKKNQYLLIKHPQLRGVCQKVFTLSPKKPNSALRKVAKIKLSTKEEIIAFIPGEGFSIQEHNFVLIKGGCVKDLPGVRYRVVRGARESIGVEGRKTSRSKYGSSKSNNI